MILQASYGHWLTEADDEISIENRTFSEFVDVNNDPKECTKYKQITQDEYKQYMIIKTTKTFEPSESYLSDLVNTIELTENSINNISLSKEKSLKYQDLYPVWGKVGAASFGTAVKPGFIFRYINNGVTTLYEVIQAHNLQEDWVPGLSTASLYKVVDKEHEGTVDDPIPYTPSMEIFAEKYYIQNEVKYKCTRNSEIPLSHNLSELVGTYVETV